MDLENDFKLTKNRLNSDKYLPESVSSIPDQISSDFSHQDRNRSESIPESIPEQRSSKTSSESRTKSSLRIRYEAEVKIIRRKLGDLEQIRGTLGLSQRKISQLLFVDPSAWTRWTRSGEEAPPHIYRMLQWYLALEDKYPALDTTFWLSAVAKIRAPVEDQRELELLSARFEELRREVESLRAEADEVSRKSLAEERSPKQEKRRGIPLLTIAVSFVAGAIAVLLARFF